MHMTRIEIRGGNGIVITTTEGSRKADSYASLHTRSLPPRARCKIERFYNRIDRDLAAWERSMFPKKKRKHRGGRKHGKRRHAPINLLGGSGA